jgi:yeast amino acid transporter
MSAPAYRTEEGMKADPVEPSEYTKGEKASIDGHPEGVQEPKQRSRMTRIIHSFHRAEYQKHPQVIDPHGVPHAGDTSHLHRKLKGRHLQMIAIGGAIGAGLFIGSGRALATGGPGAVVLDFGLIGIMLFCTVNALGELATLFPVQGMSFKVAI